MQQKRLLGTTVLTGILFSRAFLVILPCLVWKYFNPLLIFEIAIYLACGLLVFNKWDKMTHWQKGAFIAVGVQHLALFVWAILQIFLCGKTLPGLVGWFFVNIYTLLSPLERLYDKFIIFPRFIKFVTAQNSTAYYQVYFWETGILFILFRIIHAGAIGAIIGKIVGKKKCLSKKGEQVR